MVSSYIKSKLIGIENKYFKWLEEKIGYHQKKNRYPSKQARKYYRGFNLNALTIYEGDCVHINIDDFSGSSYEIARVLECYDDNEKNIKGMIKVQWYTRLSTIKKAHKKEIPEGIPPVNEDIEVCRDFWGYECLVDLESVASKCCVIEEITSTDPNTVERPAGAMGPLYIARFCYENKFPWIKPLSRESIYKEELKKSPLALTEITNSPNKLRRNSVRKSGVLIESRSPFNDLSSGNMFRHTDAHPDGKKRVKRKLLDVDENEENVCKKLKADEPHTMNNQNFKFLSTKTVTSKRDLKRSPPSNNKIESIKTIGQCRGLKSGEISDLLTVVEGNTDTVKPSKNAAKSVRTPLKQVERRSGTRRLHETKIEDSDPSCNEISFIKTIEQAAQSAPILPPKRMSKPTAKLKETLKMRNSAPSLSPKKKIKEESFTKKTDSGNLKCQDKNLNTSKKKKKASDVNQTKKNSTIKSSRESSNKRSTTLMPPKKGSTVSEHESEFEEARAQLHVSAVPSFLPCREDQFQEIFSFVEGKLLDSTGGCMYVSGVPGTGKTATVREVVRLLHETQKEGALPSFQFLEVNAMKLTRPQQLWVQIWEGLTNERVTADHAYSLFVKSLSAGGPKRRSTLLLLDELDLLWTRKQDVMYNLFDLSSRVDSRLIVVTIANTMDLPERMMISRVSSRLGLTRMTFQPYTFKQLQEIITSRLKHLKVFDPDAIQLVARKVAAVSGDARRALDICRRATELVQAKEGHLTSPLKSPSKWKACVGMSHVSQAINEMFSLPKITAIRQCSQMGKYLLQAILTEFMRTGIEEATCNHVIEHFKSICRLEGLSPPSSSETMKLVNALSSQRILLTEHARLDLLLRIRLNISTDDVSYALSL